MHDRDRMYRLADRMTGGKRRAAVARWRLHFRPSWEGFALGMRIDKGRAMWAEEWRIGEDETFTPFHPDFRVIEYHPG